MKDQIEELIGGGVVETQIHEDITYNEIYAKLAIPNREVRYIFSEKVQNWFKERVKARDMTLLYTAFVDKDCAMLNKELV